MKAVWFSNIKNFFVNLGHKSKIGFTKCLNSSFCKSIKDGISSFFRCSCGCCFPKKPHDSNIPPAGGSNPQGPGGDQPPTVSTMAPNPQGPGGDQPPMVSAVAPILPSNRINYSNSEPLEKRFFRAVRKKNDSEIIDILKNLSIQQKLELLMHKNEYGSTALMLAVKPSFGNSWHRPDPNSDVKLPINSGPHPTTVEIILSAINSMNLIHKEQILNQKDFSGKTALDIAKSYKTLTNSSNSEQWDNIINMLEQASKPENIQGLKVGSFF